ncbi:MAG: signal peptidase I [Planctomycetota bacterium]|jgi:signal peptidase I
MFGKIYKPGRKKITVFSLFIILVVCSVYCFLSFQIIHVDGKSMEPTLMKGDYALVNGYSYVFSVPKKGDIVLVKRKTEVRSDNINLSIKRITGIPGDTVQFMNAKDNSKNVTVTLPEGEYFLVGDNTANSYDSRHYGPMKESKIIGKVIFII